MKVDNASFPQFPGAAGSGFRLYFAPYFSGGLGYVAIAVVTFGRYWQAWSLSEKAFKKAIPAPSLESIDNMNGQNASLDTVASIEKYSVPFPDEEAKRCFLQDEKFVSEVHEPYFGEIK